MAILFYQKTFLKNSPHLTISYYNLVSSLKDISIFKAKERQYSLIT